ncbi:hypothetical protein [Hoeflea sp. TYP-13]|uniref:hypothetical protein n=1 Tax=Hoeflea sp. TYP-13 TaxID=3230023 RepID=UPI0034C5C952
MLRKIAMHTFLAVATIASATLSGSIITPAQAFGWGKYASCDSPAVLRVITRRFQIADRNVLHAGLAIEDIQDVHQNNYTPATETHLIARRYCHGSAMMSDGKKRSLWFLIESGQGFAGVGDNVEFCIAGLDPWHIYGAYCRSVR